MKKNSPPRHKEHEEHEEKNSWCQELPPDTHPNLSGGTPDSTKNPSAFVPTNVTGIERELKR
ncbi:MAG: hypothetical protein U9R01_09465 [candidate division WOR-3 bacterium]|nr:hypothetical protein [candidate division WOR-3 bacterium]